MPHSPELEDRLATGWQPFEPVFSVAEGKHWFMFNTNISYSFSATSVIKIVAQLHII
jgi:hypothetical protein